LRIGIQQDDDCPRIASSPAMWVASVVLPTPPFWLSKATIMALALQAGKLGFCCCVCGRFWWLSTAAALSY
jgi:hypothetical protein